MLLQQYKDRCILRYKYTELPNYSKEIKLSFFSSHSSKTSKIINSKDITRPKETDIIVNKGIYQLQTVKVNDLNYTLVYDSGCGNFTSRKDAVDRIGNCVRVMDPFNLEVSGV